jgi:hypothetical protein
MNTVAEIQTKHGTVRVEQEDSGDVSLSGSPTALASIIFGGYPSSRRAFLRSTLLHCAGQSGSLDVPLPLRGRPAGALAPRQVQTGPWPEQDFLSETYKALRSA